MDPHTAPDVVETHISTVMFVGDRALKLLKPIRTQFLDHGTPPARVRAIDAELELNRRLEPDVYLGTADLVEGGQVSDRMLIMRRLPRDRRLSSLLDGGDAADHLRSVARRVAAFHAGLPAMTETDRPMASAAGLAGLWRSSLDEMRPSVGVVLDGDEFDRVGGLALDYLEHAGALFEQRVAEGHVRDGHGDLIADDIFMLADGPRILDCLAFDDDYRIADVLADIAFLVMDVERLAGPRAARALMAWYCEFSGEHHPATLAHHWVAYRAHVRCKVNVLRHRQGDTSAARLARQFHRQAHDHLVRSQLHVVLVGGGPGSGKTTTANALAERLNWAVIGSDTLRKDLHGIAHVDHAVERHPELYHSEATEATYAQLSDQTSQLLRRGISVVVDATWANRRHREQVRAVAAAAGAVVREFSCDVPPEIARDRIDARRTRLDDASDATPSLVASFRSDPWQQARVLDTDRDVDEIVDTAVASLFGDPRPPIFEGGGP